MSSNKSQITTIIVCFLVLGTCSSARNIGELMFKEGVGVRALGMGGAFSAVADDASAIYFNPAGMAEPGLAYSFGSLDSAKVNNEYNFNLLKLGYLGYSEARIKSPTGDSLNATVLAFGNRASWLNWGANYKYQTWNLSGVGNSGWTADIGLLGRLTPQLKFGLVAQDVLTSKERIVPASIRTGLAFKPFDGQLILAADAELYRSQPAIGHLGIELNLIDGFSLRGGIDQSEPTAGLTLDFGPLALDYGVLFPPDGKNISRFEAGLKYYPESQRSSALIKPKEFVVIDIGGAIKGGATEYSLFGGIKPGADSILEEIRAAAKDPLLDGIMLRIQGFSGGLGGMGIVQEIRDELIRAKAKGKKVVAYIEGSALGDEYYLAAVADQIIAAPGSMVGGFGKSIEIYRMKGLFDKFGIDWLVLAKGKYKNSFDWLSAKGTAEQKKMLEGLVNNLYRQMLSDVSADREIDIQKLKKLGDGGFFNAAQAKKLKLIDQVGYFRDAAGLAGKICGGQEEARFISPRLIEPEENLFSQVYGVAVIEIDGEIIPGEGGKNFIFGGSYVGSDKVVRQIRQAAEDVFVKALIIRINSPGGASVAGGEIARAVNYAKEKDKIVIASLGNIAASAGYYIAAGADKIVTDPATITGSIGVIWSFPQFPELMKKFKVTADVIKEGEHADMFSGLRKLTPEEIASIRKVMTESYNDFIGVVAAGRKMATAEVEKLAEGRVYTGTQAVELKLADKLGGFADAIDLAKAEAKMAGEPRLIYYRDLNPFFQMGQGASSALGLGDFPGWWGRPTRSWSGPLL